MIYLLRHGQDDETYIGGHSNVELTSIGIKQVLEVGEYLKNKDYKINKIISSDIKRAKQTADIINKSLEVPVEYTKLLRELNKGDLNGMPVLEANTLYPQFTNLDDINIYYPNGESMKEFYLRIQNDINKILSYDNCLIVTHRGVINMLYFYLKNIELNMDKKQFGVDHASIHQLNPKTKTINKIR